MDRLFPNGDPNDKRNQEASDWEPDDDLEGYRPAQRYQPNRLMEHDDPRVARHETHVPTRGLQDTSLAGVSLATSAARRSTSSSIAGVRRPVKVFCWLTW